MLSNCIKLPTQCSIPKMQHDRKWFWVGIANRKWSPYSWWDGRNPLYRAIRCCSRDSFISYSERSNSAKSRRYIWTGNLFIFILLEPGIRGILTWNLKQARKVHFWSGEKRGGRLSRMHRIHPNSSPHIPTNRMVAFNWLELKDSSQN